MSSAKTKAAVLANLSSFGVLAVSGVLTNVLLSRGFGTAVLGAFNELLSLYIVGAQLAAMGCHLAATRLLPLVDEQPQRQRGIMLAALLVAALASALVALAVLTGRPLLAAVFGQDLVAHGLVPLCLALSLCGVNKVMLGTLNATERHIPFALVQALRPVIVLIGVVVLWRMNAQASSVPWLVAVAEVGVAVVSVGLVLPQVALWPSGSSWRAELPAVWHFAIKVLPGGLVAEANSRVDVLVLGAMASDRVVGVYSFASMYAEGLAQLPSVIRNALNARMARMSGNSGDLWRTLPRLVRMAYLFLVPCFLAGGLAYVGIAHWSLSGADRDTALWVFGIIVCCLVLAAGALPLDLLLAQLGFPGHLSLLRGVTFALNLVGCIVLYRLVGVSGVAASVGMTYAIYSLATLLLARRLHPPQASAGGQSPC
ncbi:membrane protein involved in the export of O-antigen and teichoic acid [Burkholderiales bacterium JOSHI_001]|nr:membrane protein involved in the export of O-antigen and teichoic acid [Burkholderiales bacterium JOSHI_001]